LFFFIFSKYMWFWFSCGLIWYDMIECFHRCIEITIKYLNILINCSCFFCVCCYDVTALIND
jgi:hypothetical protein